MEWHLCRDLTQQSNTMFDVVDNFNSPPHLLLLKFTNHPAHKGCFCLSSVVSKHNCPTAVSPQCSIKPVHGRWLSISDQCTFTSSSLGLDYYEAVCLFVCLFVCWALNTRPVHIYKLFYVCGCLVYKSLHASSENFFMFHTKSNIDRRLFLKCVDWEVSSYYF